MISLIRALVATFVLAPLSALAWYYVPMTPELPMPVVQPGCEVDPRTEWEYTSHISANMIGPIWWEGGLEYQIEQTLGPGWDDDDNLSFLQVGLHVCICPWGQPPVFWGPYGGWPRISYPDLQAMGAYCISDYDNFSRWQVYGDETMFVDLHLEDEVWMFAGPWWVYTTVLVGTDYIPPFNDWLYTAPIVTYGWSWDVLCGGGIPLGPQGDGQAGGEDIGDAQGGEPPPF